MNISVIGGDLRQLTLAGLLKEEGFNVKIAGFSKGPDESLPDPSDIWESEILILPIPASNDGKTVNAPFSKDPIQLTPENLKGKVLVLGGNISKELRELFDRTGVKYIDYLTREELLIKNAIPTAEGALEIAFSEMPITLSSAKSLIVGFGRIGKILAKMLSGIGSDVTISARKCSDLAWISSLGYSALENSDLKKNIDRFDVIFNTAPALVLDKEVLKRVNSETLIIDLASKPGGVDFKTAGDLGLKVIWSLGLPGKVAPITSGKIIKDTVINILHEMGV